MRIHIPTFGDIDTDSRGLLSPRTVAECVLDHNLDAIMDNRHEDDFEITSDDILALAAIATHYSDEAMVASKFDSMLCEIIQERILPDAEFRKLCEALAAKPDALVGITEHLTFGEMLARVGVGLSDEQLQIALDTGCIDVQTVWGDHLEVFKLVVVASDDADMFEKLEQMVVECGGPPFQDDEHSLSDVFETLLTVIRPNLKNLVMVRDIIAQE